MMTVPFSKGLDRPKYTAVIGIVRQGGIVGFVLPDLALLIGEGQGFTHAHKLVL